LKKCIRFIEPSSDGYALSLRIEDEFFDSDPNEIMFEFVRAGAEFECVEKTWTPDDTDRYYFVAYGNLKTNDYKKTILDLEDKGWEF